LTERLPRYYPPQSAADAIETKRTLDLVRTRLRHPDQPSAEETVYLRWLEKLCMKRLAPGVLLQAVAQTKKGQA
jgi:hypothetical protein